MESKKLQKEIAAQKEKTQPSATAVKTEIKSKIIKAESDYEGNPNLNKLGKYDPTLDLRHYQHPTPDLLKICGTENNKNLIINIFKKHDIGIDSIKATVGPTITLYEIVPESDVHLSKIRSLEDDIMLSIWKQGTRIIAPIPGKGTIGIELPNAEPQVVSMYSVVASKRFRESTFELPVAFGRTVTNDVFMVDLAKLPHLLVAGATGQGKSVCLNVIITSLLYKKHPAELKFVLIDPKNVEFSIYGNIEKHFLAKLPDGEDAIITDIDKAIETLNSLCKEMDDRYDLLRKAQTCNIKEYNEKFCNRHLNPENGYRYMPYIVCVIDEFGDLMAAGKEIETPIARIAQKACAVGIHMVIATQRPSTYIITGTIKANFPTRIAFRVSSRMDSRTILDVSGANQLIGRGDMLFSYGSELTRIQGAFVDTPEIEAIVKSIAENTAESKNYVLPEFTDAYLEIFALDKSHLDPLIKEVASLIIVSQTCNILLIQRRFSLGYNRANRILYQLEMLGIVGKDNDCKPREVLVKTEQEFDVIWNQIK
jgi:S-DNA-T family DNA segregation ATPase FtsK/SpoIIIE